MRHHAELFRREYHRQHQNRWNDTGEGNYGSDRLYLDANADGIVDVPYAIDGGTAAEAQDSADTAQIIAVAGVVIGAIDVLLALLMFIPVRKPGTP